MTSIDPKSDRYAWGIILALLCLSLFVEGTTEQMEIARHGVKDVGGLAAEWLYEISSHFALICAALTIPIWLNIFPISLSNAARRLPIYLLGFAIFSVLHIVLMVGIRHLFWSSVADGQYNFGLFRLEPWAYEIRKDVFSYVLILSTFLTARHIGAMQEELEAARQDAKRTGRLSLKSGGRTIALPAEEIVHAKSSGNYVEIHTKSGMHFIRITLAELEVLLRDAAADPVRLHRSYLTTREHLHAFDTNGAVLSTGVRLPIGRKYKSGLAA
ncbi:MAG: LytTR family DNA-binding domain-containing protein [Litorimonas sp.]